MEDIRVLDLTHNYFGPFCTMLLADMGAKVIKIEPPWGEILRFRPPLVKGVSTTFLYFNRNKKGMKINLMTENGVKIFKELVKISDVVVENFAPGSMAGMGIGYKDLIEVNPNIIFASLSGFGQTGPYAERRSYARIAEAMSGYQRLNGDGVDPNGPPVPAAEAYGDLGPGLWAVFSILAAIRYKDKTGQGQLLDVAQTDCMVAQCGVAITNYTITGEMPWERRRKYMGYRGFGKLKAMDGYVEIAIPEHMRERLSVAMGVQEVPSSEDFQKWVETRTVDEVVKKCVEAKLPVAPILSIDKTIQDPHILERDMIVEIEHPTVGKIKTVNFPVKFSKTPSKIRSPPPLLGQHNDEILSELLNYTAEEISKLKDEGVI